MLSEPAAAELDVVVHTILKLQEALEDLAVGGLRAVGPERAAGIDTVAEDLEQCGAVQLAGSLRELTAAIQRDDRTAPGALMRSQASLRLFERVLTLRTMSARLAHLATAEGSAP